MAGLTVRGVPRRLVVWLARHLRYFADRIDRAHAPKATHWRFTFEDHEGIRFREDDRGCRVWYIDDADYERAFTESDSAARQAEQDAQFAALTAAANRAGAVLDEYARSVVDSLSRAFMTGGRGTPGD